ncbi:MAG: transcription elongation factor GreA [Ruminococcaceae bacterium]|nr:transcription elongation factor GreA [Oscillospiraceae bacterium]
MMAQEKLLTSAGYKELEEELEELRVKGRQEIKEKIQVALSFGDLSENSEYDEARNDQAKLEARIKEIEETLSTAKIIDEEALSTDVIQMGSKVTIKDIEYGDIYKYQIISSSSTSKDKGVDYLTSDESPVAKAIIGHKVGDIVDVEAPIGIIKYEIVEITK